MSSIFIVDDHALMRDGLRLVLEHGGHRVVGEADDMAIALGEIERLRPDVLLLDIHLDRHSGLDLLDKLRGSALPTRTLVLTMSSQAWHVTEALRLGVTGYVRKGSPAVEVLAAVAAVGRNERYLGAGVEALAEQDAMPWERTGSPVDLLSARERQIIEMVVRGQSSAAIGQALHLSPKTVDSYRSRLMSKLEVSDVPALVRLAIREGIIGLSDT